MRNQVNQISKLKNIGCFHGWLYHCKILLVILVNMRPSCGQETASGQLTDLRGGVG